jgi:hypothetical protein
MAYEFNDEQNLTIKKLTNQMNFVGIFLLILGALFAIQGIMVIANTAAGEKDATFIFDFVLALVFVVMGIMTMKSANSFKRVTTTEGDDIDHLMEAIHKLTTWFSIQVMMIVIGIAILIVSLII